MSMPVILESFPPTQFPVPETYIHSPTKSEVFAEASFLLPTTKFPLPLVNIL